MEKTSVPGFKILHPVGSGGQAKVYLAARVSDGMQVALKVLDANLKNDKVFLQRFEREYNLIASINNEHVVRIYDHGFSGEHPFIAMEFLSSGTLASRIRGGIEAREALLITSQIARALDDIHARGIVHRDLKPANILFRADGRPVIVDFGLARDLGVSSSLTIAGPLIATPRYMSPEQCMGEKVDARSDLYSLGAIFYEMLTGQKIYNAANAAAVVNMHVNAPIPRLDAPLAGYQPILDKMLAKKPADRYQSARELFAAIAA